MRVRDDIVALEAQNLVVVKPEMRKYYNETLQLMGGEGGIRILSAA